MRPVAIRPMTGRTKRYASAASGYGLQASAVRGVVGAKDPVALLAERARLTHRQRACHLVGPFHILAEKLKTST